ncbi:MAG: hypothetical protein U9R68_07920, partial [Planctomycetota bacterium]|nr:hypothetical protein [Planctomycetota bacterium]
RVHFENRRTGRRLDFENVHASLGELASTQSGYVALSADLCRAAGGAEAPGSTRRLTAPARTREASSPLREQRGTPQGQRAPGALSPYGHVVVTANLDRLHVGPDEMPVGSMKAEWSHLPWPRLWAAVAPDSPLAGALRETSGRMSATVGRETWSAEGAVQAGRLAWPAGRDRPPTALLPEAILGFRLHRTSASAPVVLDLVKFSAPGLDLKMTGTVAPARPATGEDAGADPGRPWPIPALDLDADGAVTWGPLCQSAAPLRPLLETFDRLGGTARLHLHVTTSGEGLRLKASADLSDTVMVAEGRFEKGEHDPLRLRLEGTCDRRFRTISDGLLDVVTGGARLRLKGTAPLDGLIEAVRGTGPDGADEPARLSHLAGAQATATAEVQDTESVVALVPALGKRLGPLEARGPCRIELAVQPLRAADGAGAREEAAAGQPAGADRRGTPPPAWTAVVHADFTDTALDLRVPGGSKKPAGTLARFDADAVFWPAIRRSDVRRLAVQLGEGSIAWDGSARIDWPRKEGERPVGRFEGTLTLDRMAKAGSILAPERFGHAPSVAGGAVFDVAADLAEGRLRTHMEAGLGRMDLRLGRYLVKPAGRPASLALTSLWHTGRWNHVEGDADLDLPGVHLSALGQATLVAQWQDYPAAPGGEAGPLEPRTPDGHGPLPHGRGSDTDGRGSGTDGRGSGTEVV